MTLRVDQEEIAAVAVRSMQRANTILCSGSSVVLTASPGFASYQWYDANGLVIDATLKYLLCNFLVVTIM